MDIEDTTEVTALESIIQRAKSGNNEAFTALYELYVTPLYRYIFFRVSDPRDAEDLTQEVFLKAYVALSRYVSNGTPILAYFYTIARNSIIDHYRKKKERYVDTALFDTIADESPLPNELASNRKNLLQLRKDISVLAQDQQDAITLRYLDEFDTTEIAKIMNRSPESVRQLQSRGLKILRDSLNKKQYE